MKRLMKSRRDKIIDGVLGGVAESINVDPVIVRIIYLIFAFTADFGTALILYIAAMIIMPLQDDIVDVHWEPVKPTSISANVLIGGLLVVLGFIFLLKNFAGFEFFLFFRKLFDYAWPLALIAIGAFFLIRGRSKA